MLRDFLPERIRSLICTVHSFAELKAFLGQNSFLILVHLLIVLVSVLQATAYRHSSNLFYAIS